MKTMMKPGVVVGSAFLVLGACLAFAPPPALAAHAGAPYTNVDPRNDRGNNTGDSQIEGLNERQLDQNYWQAAQQPGGVPNPPYFVPQSAPR